MRFKLATLFAVAMSLPASAHDWYPVECCHQMDCAPVDKAELVKEPMHAGMMTPLPGKASVANGALIVTTVHGTAVVPPDMVRRESKDSRMHACIRGGKVVCVFIPPAM